VLFYPARTTTPTTADSLNNLPTIVVYRTYAYPSLEAEGAVALCLSGVRLVSFTGCGVETLTGGRYPYLVHSGNPSSVGQASGCSITSEAVPLFTVVPYHIRN
jgi:hypothetical protein